MNAESGKPRISGRGAVTDTLEPEPHNGELLIPDDEDGGAWNGIALVKPSSKARPYRPEYCDRLIELCAGGLSPGGAAGGLGVSRSTLYRWLEIHPEFAAAKEVAEAASQLFWEKRLVQTSDRGGAPGAAACTIFGIKNRARHDWRDTFDVNSTGTIQVTIGAADVGI